MKSQERRTFRRIMRQEFRHHSVPYPNECKDKSTDRMNERLLPQHTRWRAVFDPLPQTIKTPSSRPRKQWTKCQTVHESSKCTPARLIVVACFKVRALGRRHVFPIA